jgi:ABC-type multidrug transport system permease subunit
MDLLFVAFDVALAALAVRSMVVLGARAPWTSLGWFWTLAYCVPAAIRFSGLITSRALTVVADVALVFLIVAFVVAGVRDEPQAEPWWWPVGVGLTRAQKRR